MCIRDSSLPPSPSLPPSLPLCRQPARAPGWHDVRGAGRAVHVHHLPQQPHGQPRVSVSVCLCCVCVCATRGADGAGGARRCDADLMGRAHHPGQPPRCQDTH
eukprot:2629625-Rhodomonas_salina.1